MKLSICTEAVFAGLDTCAAMERVRSADYDTFEFWGFWDKDVAKIAEAKARLGLTLSLMCTKFTSLVDKSQHASYLDGLALAIEAAGQLDCRLLVTQSGADTGGPRETQRASMIEGLRRSADMLAGTGITLLLEPLNRRRDHPDSYLETCAETCEILDAVSRPEIRMLFDIYHQQISEGDIITRIGECLPYIAHFHCAGNPGRAELSCGELDYGRIFKAIHGMGYTGALGLEYFPKRDAAEGLKHVRDIFRTACEEDI